MTGLVKTDRISVRVLREISYWLNVGFRARGLGVGGRTLGIDRIGQLLLWRGWGRSIV